MDDRKNPSDDVTLSSASAPTPKTKFRKFTEKKLLYFEIMKCHTILGRDAVEHAEQTLGVQVEFLKFAKEIAMSHREKWDGSGYPEGACRCGHTHLGPLHGAGRDVYDALISRRVYKKGMSHETAVLIITEGRRSHFDPDVVDAFLEIKGDFQAIAKKYADSDQDLKKKSELQQVLAARPQLSPVP